MSGQTLGRMIASLRKERGMTQLELAERMGVTDKAVSKWERDVSEPDISQLGDLAAALGVPLETLLGCRRPTGRMPAPFGRSRSAGRYPRCARRGARARSGWPRR